MFGSVVEEESLGAGPSFSKESSSVAASRHLHLFHWDNKESVVTVPTE